MTQRQGEFRGTPHELTTEERRKGALATNEKRRQQGLSLRARVSEKLEAEADGLVAAALKQAKGGDWQAFLALWKQTHGTPPVEVTGEDGSPIQVEVADARARLADEAARFAERERESGST